MQDHTRIGDLVIANGAVRQEGTSLQYMPIEFPAVPSSEMVSALESAAIESESKYHIGVVQSKDSFYGQHDPNSMPVSYDLNQKWDAWVKGGVLCSEMEVSTLFVVGSYRRVRTGALLVIYGDQKRQEALSKESYLESVNKATSIILESSLKI
jgi:uridine phosphorylase